MKPGVLIIGNSSTVSSSLNLLHTPGDLARQISPGNCGRKEISGLHEFIVKYSWDGVGDVFGFFLLFIELCFSTTMYIFWQLYLLCAFLLLLQIKLPPCMPLANKWSRNRNLLTFTVKNSVSLGVEHRGGLGRGKMGKHVQKPAGDAEPLPAFPQAQPQYQHAAEKSTLRQPSSLYSVCAYTPGYLHVYFHYLHPPIRRKN